jgi:hypothetical protein
MLRILTLAGVHARFLDILDNYAMRGREWGICVALQQYGGPFW